jgi:hypothetical protein
MNRRRFLTALFAAPAGVIASSTASAPVPQAVIPLSGKRVITVRNTTDEKTVTELHRILKEHEQNQWRDR